MNFATSLFAAWILLGGWSSPAVAQTLPTPAPSSRPPAALPPASPELGVAASTASGDYVLASADTIEMSVFHQPDLTTRSPIASDGSVQFPLIGELKLGGMALRDAREIIRKRYNADYLVEPQVYLNVVAYAQHTFTILGQVNRPGSYEFPGGKPLNLLEAVGLAGGFARAADPGKITVKRRLGSAATTLKVSTKERGSEKQAAFALQPGDVVTVRESWF